MSTWTEILMSEQARYPDTALVRLMAQRFGLAEKRKLKVLDIGPGGGAVTRFLEDNYETVVSVDVSHAARAHYHRDIRDAVWPGGHFDVVVDYKTLCHVPDAPFDQIARWLKPGGKLISVAPAPECNPVVGDGKTYTRFASEYEMRDRLKAFTLVKVEELIEPYHGRPLINFVIEATR